MLILASASPRRRELLTLITDRFTVITADVDETIPPDCPPDRAVQDLAVRKAAAVAESHTADIVVGADTVVALEHTPGGWEILGKPLNEAHAAAMLARLSDRTHAVFTGVAVLHGAQRQVFCQRTQVEFGPLTETDIAAYIATGEPMDKAGAYGIQGKGARFVRRIDGDYCTVVGLPVYRLYEILRRYFDCIPEL